MMLIYDLCYRLYFWLKRFRRWNWPKLLKKITQKSYEWYGYYFGLFLNRKMVPWFEKHPVVWGLNTKKRSESYTVSLTSFPARIDYVHIAIETLMRQSFKPDRIVLWLADSQFPDEILPEKLTALKEKGLTIRFCDDLRSHKKYYFSFLDYPNDCIILVDDDIFYPKDMAKRLAKCHTKHPKDIIGTTAQIIGPTMGDLPTVWPVVQNARRYENCHSIQPFTGMGTLYPAKWYTKEVFDREKLMRLASTADDLWLKAMSIVADTKTTLVYPVRGFPIEIQIEDNQTLFAQNGVMGENKNDEVWSNLVKEYHLNQSLPCEG